MMFLVVVVSRGCRWGDAAPSATSTMDVPATQLVNATASAAVELGEEGYLKARKPFKITATSMTS